jgi:hypothetical protein
VAQLILAVPERGFVAQVWGIHIGHQQGLGVLSMNFDEAVPRELFFEGGGHLVELFFQWHVLNGGELLEGDRNKDWESATLSDSLSLSLELSAQLREAPVIDALPALAVSVRVPDNCGMENQSS